MNHLEFSKKIEFFFNFAHSFLGDHFEVVLEDLKIKNTCTSFSVSELFKICNKLNITMDSIFKERVDFQSIKNFLNKRDSLPLKYVDKAPYSSRFTSFYIIDYLRKKFGENSAKVILQHFQLTNRDFIDLSQKNNILLSLDLIGYVDEYWGESYVSEIGRNSTLVYLSTPEGREHSKIKTVPRLFEKLIDELAPKTIEKNYNWSFNKLSSKKIFISGQPKEEIVELFGPKIIHSKSLEVLRKGFIESIPQFIPGCVGNCQQIKSISHGDPHDLYELNYEYSDNVVPLFSNHFSTPQESC